jgi:hypothetical protein
MQVESEKDFQEMRKQFARWRKNFPMFKHDVSRIENIVENHVQQYSKLLVSYRQTHKNCYLEQAQHQIDEINRVLSTVEKIELMAFLSR